MGKPLPPKKIAHIGIAVHSIEKAIPFYINHLQLELEKMEDVPSEQVKVAFLKIGETRIELLEPTNDTSAIYQFLQKRGEGVHHIAIEVDDLEYRLNELRNKGIQLINNEPKQGANNSLIAFIHPHSANGILMELCEHQKKG